MTKTISTALVVFAGIPILLGAAVPAHATYNDPNFTLQNDSQCSGGTLLVEYSDVQDTSNFGIWSKQFARLECQNLMTGSGQCCDVDYRRVIVPPPGVGIYYFDYNIYTGATVAPETPPADWTGPATMPALQQPTTVYERWAGIAGVTSGQCTGTWQLDYTDYSDLSCPVDLNKINAYKTVPKCPPNLGQCTGGICKVNTIAESGAVCVVQTDIYNCVDSSGTPISVGCTATPPPVTAALVANPNALYKGESSLLIWSSTNATECTGTNFNTGGDDAGSVVVSPSNTTTYSVTCTNSASSATANATVSVSTPSQPDPFTVSCRGAPSSTITGEAVVWSSTVTGGEGTYTYAWGGTDELSGNGNQVVKSYDIPGTKTASLTVTYTPVGSVESESSSPPTTLEEDTTNSEDTSSAEDDTSSGLLAEPTTACPLYAFTTPLTQCTNGSWVATYDAGGCQTGWQCVSTGTSGTQTAPQETDAERSFFEMFDFLNFIPRAIAQTGSSVPPQDSEQTITAQCENSVHVRAPQCSDGIDNDGDGLVDYPNDPGCESPEDDDETDYPQCSDGIDNDNDGYVDYPNEPGCTDDDDDDESDDPVEPTPQCSDGIDNDGDGAVDEEDAGCYTTPPGGSGGGTYDPGDNSESGGGSGTGGAACSDGVDNDGDGNVDYPDDLGCASAADGDESSDGPPDITITTSPKLLKPGEQCTITIFAKNVESCTLTGEGVSRTFIADDDGNISETSVLSPALTKSALYKLTCDAGTAILVETAQCRIAPSFDEF